MWKRVHDARCADTLPETTAPLCNTPAAGEITTIAGWVTKPGMEPVWIRKSLSVVQGRQQLRGTGTEFQNLKGFDRPIDTAFDPAAPGVIYVSDFGHHIIWRLTILAGVGPSGEPNVQVRRHRGWQHMQVLQ